MLIPLSQLKDPLKIDVTGDESWLNKTYQQFREVADRAPDSKIAGSLTIAAIEDGHAAHVAGQLQFTPFLACSRCSDPLRWPLQLTLDVRVVKEEQSLEDTENTTETYALNDAGEIDLGGLIYDLMVSEIPSQTLAVDPATDSCRKCGISLADDVVYTSEETPEERSPFAELKKLIQ